ncbi:MAG: hypothetical protein ACK452_08840 [Bacteroidota bacterium]|jgi:hypothetical protein
MNLIHITGIDYVEVNQNQGLEFKYKPEVPKLQLLGNVLVEETEEEEQSVVFLTQKQLNQVLANKEVELKLTDDERWYPVKPLTKDQVKKVGLVTLESELIPTSGEIKCYEVQKVVS